MDYSNWIVNEIPGLHRTYANLGDNGHWIYWEQLEDDAEGRPRWKWNPKWHEYTAADYQEFLNELIVDRNTLENEMMEIPAEQRGPEWNRKMMDLDGMIRFYTEKLMMGNN